METSPGNWKVAVGAGFVSLAVYLSGFFIWLSPLPLLVAFKKGSRLQGIVAALFPLFLLGILYFILLPEVADHWGEKRALEIFFWLPGMGMGRSFGLWYYGFFAIMGLLLATEEPRATSMSLMVARVAGILIALIFIWMLWQVKGNLGGMVADLEEYFNQILLQFTRTPSENEDLHAQMSLIQGFRQEIVYYAVRLLPAFFVNFVIFSVWLNVVVARRIFVKDSYFPKLESLKNWRLPFLGVWLTIGFGAMFFLDLYLLHSHFLRIISLNTLLLFCLIYFFQGLAIVAYYSARWSISPLIRLLFYGLLLLFFQPLGLLLVAFGFFDSWFDFRKLTPKPAGT